MQKARTGSIWLIVFAAILLIAFFFSFPSVIATTVTDIEDHALQDDTIALLSLSENDPTPNAERSIIKKGLIEENGVLYYYNDDGTLFTGGYKEVVVDGITRYYFFQENGSAFTGGYKELVGETGTDYYYFLGNGQAFTSGYKTVKIDNITYYYFFENNGKAFTGGFKDVPFGTQTYSYYFQKDGKALVSEWLTQNNLKYYFLANGRVATGWFCAGEAYYYAPTAGALSANTVVHGYRLDAEGKSITKYRINEYVKQHTKPSMTNQQKIRALYDWVLSNDMEYLRTYEHTKADWIWHIGWVDDFATSQMDNWGGNCYRYAAFLGMLIREATGLEVKVYQGQTPAAAGGLTYHGWSAVKQNGKWYIYDVELQKHSDISSDLCYKVPADSSTTHFYGEGFNLY